MCGIKTTVLCCYFSESDNLFSLRVGAGDIDKSRGESDRAIFHCLLDQCFHPGHFLRRWRTVIKAHHPLSHEAMRGECSEVDCDRLFVYSSKKFRNISR